MTGPSIPGSTRQLNQALPGIYVDIIRSGLPQSDARDHRKVWGACVRIAMSAYRRGWSEAQFTNEVARNESNLWRQLRTKRDGRTRSDASAYRDLHKAWDTGVANLRGVGMRTPDEVRADAVERAMLWADQLTDRADGLTDAQSGVMSYVVAETQRRGMLRVTCPGRDVAESAKLSHQTAHRTLKALTRNGFLIKHYAERGGPSSTGKAAIYELADPERCGRKEPAPRRGLDELSTPVIQEGRTRCAAAT